MKKVSGQITKFKAGTLRKSASAVATAETGNESLRVVRPTMKQATLAANRLMKKLGWELAQPWERLP